MKKTKFLKALSYVVLSISIVILILSVMCIAIKNSDYLNEDKYFKSEKFAYNYLMTLQDSADRLIHNNSLYDSVKDGDMNIYYLDMQNSYSNYTTIKNMNFLIIYKNKAITNIRKNTINQIKEYINSSQDSKTKKVDILDGSIQTDSESISQYGDKYLDNFLITYYTTDTIRTDTKLDDGRYIEYISAEAKDFEIYSSYTEELNLSTERQMATSFLNMVAPINNNVYVFFPISALLTLLLIIYLTSVIGHDGNEDSTININTFDRIPIEIIAFCAMLIGCMPFILLEFAENDYNAINSIAITAYFVIYICTAITMTTVIKRIKAKQLLKTSIIGKVFVWCLQICKKIVKKMNEIWNTITYSPNTTAKVIITAGLTVFVWLLIVAISGNSTMFPIIAIGLIVFILYKTIKIFKDYLQIEKKLKDVYEGNTQSELDEKSVENVFKNSVIYLNDISNGFENAVQDRMKSERMKAELITNVSHDIKTPLTSIINYVDLLKQENIQKAREYIEILENKSQRLKRLTEDLVEASKVSTGNIYLNLEKINIVELIKQATGEFEDKFKRRELEPIINADQNEINIMADSKYMYRIIENLYSNISKYALENSRVYVDIKLNKTEPVPNVPNVQIDIKNISKDKLNISADELMQRFVRGDKSRTTEGSGLGISIAQNLTELQNGKFELKLDGDLFKVELTFNII
mgnify:CR=1 FL=1